MKENLSSALISKSRESSSHFPEKNFIRETTSPKITSIGPDGVDLLEVAGTISNSDLGFGTSSELSNSPHLLTKFNFQEGVHLNSWKLMANISSKVLAEDEEYVRLECLIDKEERLYEEREFSKTLFDGFNFKVGSLFKICIHKRQNQEMIEIKDGSKLVNQDDFPKADFFGQFGDLILEKKID